MRGMGRKLKNAPVYYVLAQVRFNTVALLDRYVPDLQDSLRKAGYPDFNKAVLATISMDLGGGGAQVVPALESHARYQFLNASRTSGFLLDQSSLSFQTTDYDVFEPFSEALLSGIEILHKNVELSFSERLGLRYFDAVCPREGETLSQYLIPSMLSLSDQIGDRNLIHASSETKTQKGKVFLLGRVTILNQPTVGVAFPQELQPIALQVTEKFRGISGLYGIIDTDSWIEGREKFDLGEIKKSLISLRDEVRFSFGQMATPHALNVWN